MKAHTRSAEVEEVLADLSEVTDAPSEIYSMLTNADMTYGVVENPDGGEVEITQANFTKLQKNPDRKFRERVHETFYDEWAGVRNTVGTLKKAVREHATSAEIRGYDSARVRPRSTARTSRSKCTTPSSTRSTTTSTCFIGMPS